MSFPGSGVSPSVGDYILDVTYFDLSITHPDFTGSSTTSYTNPNYVFSPYGNWLSVASDPTSGTFTDWFRHKNGKNYKFEEQVKLENEVGELVMTHRLVLFLA